MSLFDIIKYPLSAPPKLEELRALPISVVNEVLDSIKPGYRINFVGPMTKEFRILNIHGILNYYYISSNNIEYDKIINFIKKLIREHDEPL